MVPVIGAIIAFAGIGVIATERLEGAALLPLLLTIGWGVLRLPLHQKLLYPVLMLAYFALMVPHKALLSLLILQQMSVLFMPLLYLCFGTVLDLMVFVALYSWLASLAPADAVADAG